MKLEDAMESEVEAVYEELLAALVEDAGARSAVVLSREFRVLAGRVSAPVTQELFDALLAQDPEGLRRGAVSQAAPSGERVGLVAAGGDGFLVAVFPAKASERLVEVALTTAVEGLPAGRER